MLKIVAYLLITVFLISILRAVIGFVMKAFVALAQPRPPQAAPKVPLTGELKKDPVCGTYTSAAASLHETVNGQTFYFCSPACRDKFALEPRKHASKQAS